MYPLTKGKVIPVDQAAKTDPFVQEAANRAAKGEVSAQAPSGQDKIVWTDADVKRLDEALTEAFSKKG